MEPSVCAKDESPLLTALPLIQRLVYGSIDRKEFIYAKSQMVILLALHIRRELTMKEVAGYLSSSKEQATRAVAVLVDDGLVERFEDPSNRVHVYVRLTPLGEAYLQKLSGTMKNAVKIRLEDSLSPEQIARLESFLLGAIDILQNVK